MLRPLMLPLPELHAPRGELPVLLSVPHAGREYPDPLMEIARGGVAALQAVEDPFVDRLAERAIERGFGAVIARAPRAAVDCNRAEDDIDPSVVDVGPVARLSARARGGLGVVPGRTASHGTMWRRPISRHELEQRLDQAHRPYHSMLDEQLALLLDRFGCALLLDCHSMPPPGRGVPEVVIGDRYGRTAARWVTEQAVRSAAAGGFKAAINDPFAGGHIIERHGAPHREVQAIQIEVDRRCYLSTDGSRPGEGFESAAMLIVRLAEDLGRLLLERRYPAAAE